jgi:hypothetical protein
LHIYFFVVCLRVHLVVSENWEMTADKLKMKIRNGNCEYKYIVDSQGQITQAKDYFWALFFNLIGMSDVIR